MLKFNALVINLWPSTSRLKDLLLEIEFFTDKCLKVANSILEADVPCQTQIGTDNNAVRGKFYLVALMSTQLGEKKFKNNVVFQSSGRWKWMS